MSYSISENVLAEGIFFQERGTNNAPIWLQVRVLTLKATEDVRLVSVEQVLEDDVARGGALHLKGG